MPFSRGSTITEPRAVFVAIWKVVAWIPRGRVATYGQVARMAGMPGAARTAGWALRALPAGQRVGGRPVPWHRVINAGGRVSPRAGDAFDEGERQRRKLRGEGVRLSSSGRINLGLYGWKGR